MTEKPLSERKKQILNAIVTAHIAYGEPVGSKLLADNRDLRCSSATIRNEMAELEAMGYLEQPHTSAGRVPSERGYRYYVDMLRERYEDTNETISHLNLAMQEKLTELDEILSEASRLASSLTNYTGIALKPRTSRTTVEKFEAVYLSERNFILVMVMTGGSVKTKNVHLAFAVEKSDIDKLMILFNRHLSHKTADKLTVSVICDIERDMGITAAAVVSPLVKTVYEAMNEEDGGEVRVEGVNRLLQYPEYSDVGEFRNMLGMLEEKDRLLDIFDAGADSTDDMSIYIGKENGVDVMKNSTLIYRTIRKNGEVIGAIGIIGPQRMDYSKVIETIDRLASGVDRMINDKTATPGLPPKQSGED